MSARRPVRFGVVTKSSGKPPRNCLRTRLRATANAPALAVVFAYLLGYAAVAGERPRVGVTTVEHIR